MNRGNPLLDLVWIGIIGVVPLQGMAAEPPVDTEKIAKEARETIEATKQYAVQQKEAFQRKAHEELVAIQKQIIALRGKASETTAVTRTELQKSMNELEKKWGSAKNKLDEMRAATDAKWTDLKAVMNSALDELKNAYLKALSHLP